MIKRIVRLTMKDTVSMQAFEDIYERRNPHKKSVKGCLDVKVMRDVNEENVYYTVSTWESNGDLEAYRQSPYFKETWPMVKANLAKRAEAYSMMEIEEKK